MVHWLGEGTDVMLCLAREPPPGPTEDVKSNTIPSSVYISYDNGNTFEDKTYLFQINDTENKLVNSSVDQFTTHPTYNTVSSRAIYIFKCINLVQFNERVELIFECIVAVILQSDLFRKR